jgi:hypothetical protein
MSTNNNTVKSETNQSTTKKQPNKDISNDQVDYMLGEDGKQLKGNVYNNFGTDSILNFSIPQWDYITFAAELNSFRKGLTGIATEPGWFYFKIFFHFDESFGLLGNILTEKPGNTAYNYLLSRQNLFKYDNLQSRALALKKFVKYLSFINCNAPWFFDKIDGLDKATVSLNEFNKEKQITISCLEDAVDMRLTSLFHLYQYACYDEINMKEIIPENLRKFNMTIVLYHVPIKYFSTQIPGADAKSLQGVGSSFSNRMSYKMFTFKGCEFNLESLGAIVPSSIDNAQPFSLAKSGIIINYDRVFTHLMNEWNQFMIGPDGIYFDKENKIDDYDPSFLNRISEIIKTTDNSSLALVDTLLVKPASIFVNQDISLGNIYNIDVREFRQKMLFMNSNNKYIGNIYGLNVNEIKARIIAANNSKIFLGNLFSDKQVSINRYLAVYNNNIPKLANDYSEDLNNRTFVKNRKLSSLYTTDEYERTLSSLDKRFFDRQDRINKQYEGDMEFLESHIYKYGVDNIGFYLNASKREYYFTTIQNLKDIWNNLAVSWKNVKSTLKYTLDNAFKIRF